MPHKPGQGSLHFCRMQAILAGHSALIVHSGLQFGGLPLYVGKQEHDGIPPISRHSENAPQGDGIHGSLTTSFTMGGFTEIIIVLKFKLIVYYIHTHTLISRYSILKLQSKT